MSFAKRDAVPMHRCLMIESVVDGDRQLVTDIRANQRTGNTVAVCQSAHRDAAEIDIGTLRIERVVHGATGMRARCLSGRDGILVERRGFGLDDPLVVHAVNARPPAPAAVAARNVRRLKADPVNGAIAMIVIVLV